MPVTVRELPAVGAPLRQHGDEADEEDLVAALERASHDHAHSLGFDDAEVCSARDATVRAIVGKRAVLIRGDNREDVRRGVARAMISLYDARCRRGVDYAAISPVSTMHWFRETASRAAMADDLAWIINGGGEYKVYDPEGSGDHSPDEETMRVADLDVLLTAHRKGAPARKPFVVVVDDYTDLRRALVEEAMARHPDCAVIAIGGADEAPARRTPEEEIAVQHVLSRAHRALCSRDLIESARLRVGDAFMLVGECGADGDTSMRLGYQSRTADGDACTRSTLRYGLRFILTNAMAGRPLFDVHDIVADRPLEVAAALCDAVAGLVGATPRVASNGLVWLY
eukprot:scaffold5394_cov274-Prasinococcus_capsulatus_cf.AAC.4